MPLKLNLAIPNRAIHALIAIAIVAALVVGANAFASSGTTAFFATAFSSAKPWHTLQQLQHR